jgi:hypothetical protein
MKLRAIFFFPLIIIVIVIITMLILIRKCSLLAVFPLYGCKNLDLTHDTTSAGLPVCLLWLIVHAHATNQRKQNLNRHTYPHTERHNYWSQSNVAGLLLFEEANSLTLSKAQQPKMQPSSNWAQPSLETKIFTSRPIHKIVWLQM